MSAISIVVPSLGELAVWADNDKVGARRSVSQALRLRGKGRKRRDIKVFRFGLRCETQGPVVKIFSVQRTQEIERRVKDFRVSKEGETADRIFSKVRRYGLGKA